MPSLVSIGAFEAAARHRSFARAAAELGTSAASVSYHIRQLESQLGVRLFRRLPQHVELTKAGSAAAEATMEAFALLRSSFAKAADVGRSTLKITALPTFGTAWLVPRLGALKASLPGIRLELDLSPDARDLNGDGFDIAIRNGDGRWPGLRSTFLFPSLFMPLCAPSLIGAVRESGWPDRDSRIPLLGRRDWWRDWFTTLGSDGEREPELEFATEYLDTAAAIAGHGITLASPLLCRSDLEAGRLVPAHDLVIATGRDFWLTVPAVRADREAVGRFADWIVAQARQELRESGRWIESAVPCGGASRDAIPA